MGDESRRPIWQSELRSGRALLVISRADSAAVQNVPDVNCRASRQKPQTARRTPVAALIRARNGSTFSKQTRSVSAAIQRMFITPAAKSKAINAQQQPVQNAPCSNPIRNAPILPSRQRVMINSNGPRQCVKQVRLSGVN